MRRVCILGLLVIGFCLPTYSQFWVSFDWGGACRHCQWMIEAMHLPPSQAVAYHEIIHAYGMRIEKEVRREYRHWDDAARRIYDLRMERDQEIRDLLTYAQFTIYLRLMREYPQRIHDYRGWYANPKYPDRRPSNICRHYEDNYWNHRWDDRRYRKSDRPQRIQPQPARSHSVKPEPDKDKHKKEKEQEHRYERDRRYYLNGRSY